ncbi:MAG: hypothetical protein H6835_00080 [Planctomycetes bacterium]|nr:hypothetical protein [Deltaproteobacteria bacterium]MCB9875973.1 hypothetical protein [Planctomycetota bacterium]
MTDLARNAGAGFGADGVVPGLRAPSGVDSVPARLRWLEEAPIDALAEALVRWLEELSAAATGLGPALAAWHGVAVGEAVASPFTLRAVAAGTAVGARIAHLERQAPLHWREALRGDEAVHDAHHGSFERGVRIQGRYQGFALEGAMGGFDPNHSARWTPHELLHRAVGFAAWPGIGRFPLYLCARAAELLPVVHWYGLDPWCRLRDRDFDRDGDARNLHAAAADAIWLQQGPERATRARQGIAGLRAALRHFARELETLEQEAATGRVISLVGDPAMPHAELDSSSDAIAYVSGHHRRLADPLVGATLVRHADPALRQTEVAALFAQLRRALHDLFFRDLRLRPATVDEAAARRRLWEVALRLATTGTAAEAASSVLATLPSAANAPLATVLAALDALPQRLASLGLKEVVQLGLASDPPTWPDRSEAEITAIAEGIGQVTSGILAVAEANGCAAALARAVASRDAAPRGPIAMRAAAVLPTLLAPRLRPAAADLASVELAICGATRADDVVERLAVAPDEDDPEEPLDAACRIVRSEAFRWVPVGCDVLHWLEGDDDARRAPPPGRSGGLLVGRFRERTVLLPCPDAIGALLRALDAAPMPVGEAFEFLDEALEDGDDGGWTDLPADAEVWLDELRGAGVIGVLELAGGGQG